MDDGFGGLLRKCRLQVGWTQEQLADASGVSAHTISVLEAGRRRPRLSSVARLGAALDLDPAAQERLLTAARPDATAADADTDAEPVGPDVLPVPRLLPYAVADFTGRHRELEHFLPPLTGANAGASTGAGVSVVCIDGMAGVGKTALAVHLGHALADTFPDGQLFVDLHGFTPGQSPLDPGAALVRLLRAVGVSEVRLPGGTEERAHLWRSEVADRRLLVVLDNAVDAAQVRPLIPSGPGSMALITSRCRMPALAGATGLSLDVLSDSEAADLFTRIADPRRVADQRQAVGEIVRLCGRLPLAIRIAAARLAHHPVWTPEHLLARLRDRQRLLPELSVQDRSVAAAFADSYRALPPEQRRLFRLAALHPGDDFTVPALAALGDLPPSTTEGLLDDLYDHHLLVEHVPGRFTFHDLLRYFARQLVSTEEPPESRQAALVRLLDHYRYAAARAMDRLFPLDAGHRPPIPAPAGSPPAFADRARALDWLDQELRNLLEAAAQAAELGAPRYTAELPAILWRHLVRRIPADQALLVNVRALEAARQLGDQLREAETLRQLGLVHFQLGNYPTATALLGQGLALHRRIGNPAGEAHTLTNLGLVLARTGRPLEALRHHQRALAISRRTGDRAVEIVAQSNLGPVQAQLGNHAEALEHHEQTLAWYRLAGNRLGQATSLHQLGELYQRLGRGAEARRLHQQALDLYRLEHDTFGQSESHMALGDLHLARDDPAAALVNYRAAFSYLRHTGERYNLARLHLGLARAHRRLGRLGRAREHGRRAVKLYAALDIPESQEAWAFFEDLDQDGRAHGRDSTGQP
ncbi:tetratricopeptide repeat protein [Streptacidiphilus sp. P02-A3a]|uniref:ATP-binding protein n=1 Tax=Streptacidiphilus sp. P02-A3a TaxID=2704468 RepID=UPI0015FA28C5|nr:tetratricopeptide repeat protein [Streptacidiphilus sp. P02-A3a]QMU69929.1 tetratricopeptide repeat protein [Streptacidiphilus sp. P02-A3a]